MFSKVIFGNKQAACLLGIKDKDGYGDSIKLQNMIKETKIETHFSFFNKRRHVAYSVVSGMINDRFFVGTKRKGSLHVEIQLVGLFTSTHKEMLDAIMELEIIAKERHGLL